LNRNPSLQFNMEFEEDSQGSCVVDEARLKLAIEQLRRMMKCSSATESEVKQVITDVREAASQQQAAVSCSAVAKALEERGFGVCVRTALGGGDGLDCLHNLRHHFLIVKPPRGLQGKPVAGATFIVDINFREQFQVAHATPHYRELIDQMDIEFIGAEPKLRAVIQMLCEEMARAYREQDISLPPWRQTSSMLSKWCPRRSEDYSADGKRQRPNAVMDSASYGAVPNGPKLPWDTGASGRSPTQRGSRLLTGWNGAN